MTRFILTGAPGAGKTALLRQLEFDGFGVVEEAATDLIALAQAQGNSEPWKRARFIDAVADLQRQRLLRASILPDRIQFHDRSVVCTAALATYLDYPISKALSRELDRLRDENIFHRAVFFIRNLGFITSTEARKISFDEALRFERIHEETYRNCGFEIVFVEVGNVLDRVAAIKRTLSTIQGLACEERWVDCWKAGHRHR